MIHKPVRRAGGRRGLEAADIMISMPSPAVPDVDEILSRAVVVALPMRTRFRGQHWREAMLFEGPAGWGEFAPFPEYGPQESSAWLEAGVEAAWKGLGTARRRSIPVNAIVPAVPAADVPAVLARYGDMSDIPAVKIKVAEPGQQVNDDIARVQAVHDAVPQAGIRVDANAAWSISEAAAALEQLAEAAHGQFEYAEQPVPGVEALAELREKLGAAGVPLRIAADEAVRKSQDPLRVARLGAADLIVVKVPPLGGVEAAVQIVEKSGLDAVVSSALDTSVGLAAGIALAAQLPQLPYACGLGTATLFDGDSVAEPLIPHRGELQVPQRHTAGAAPEEASEASGVITAPRPELQRVEQLRITGEREDWWKQRLRDAHQVLTQG